MPLASDPIRVRGNVVQSRKKEREKERFEIFNFRTGKKLLKIKNKVTRNYRQDYLPLLIDDIFIKIVQLIKNERTREKCLKRLYLSIALGR